MNFKEIFLVLAISVAITVTNAEYVSYDRYKVYKIVPSSEREVQILLDVKKQNHYYFWSENVALNSDVRIMVDPAKQVEFEKYFENVQIPARIVIEDVQKLINDQLRRPATRSANYAWDFYQNLDEIYAWLDQVVERHSDVATAVTLGSSVEGRPIRGIKIDFKKKENPIIGMIEGGIHAREWISPATVTYIINEFLTSSDPNVRLMADNIVWHIFPVVNPDGYSYTFSTNRMWRKNRSKYNSTSCALYGEPDDKSNGIDLNRNFGYVWMSIGASDNPCDETFAGHVEFSEPEARAIANYVTTIKNEGHMVYYFAFHSYSQMVLVPYSHVSGANVLEAANYGDMFEIAVRGMDKLQAQHGTVYRVGTSADILYPVSGSSFDWVKGVAEVPIVYLFELRDVGEFGFLLPTSRIIPNNQEIMAGLLEMEKVTRGMGYYHISGGERVLASFVMMVLALFVAM